MQNHGGTNSHGKTGLPTQKAEGGFPRIIGVSSNPGDCVLDFFAGSGTVGAVCLDLDRQFILVDNNPQAMVVMQERFKDQGNIEWMGMPD